MINNLNMLEIVKNTIINEIKNIITEQIVVQELQEFEQKMQSFEKKVRDTLKPIVDGLSFKGIENVTSLIELRTELDNFINRKDEEPLETSLPNE